MKYTRFFSLALGSALLLGLVGNHQFSSKTFAKSMEETPHLNRITPPTPPADATAKKIKIALLLDTSGSMDGLLEQAKSQLWNMVNELAQAKSNGKEPDLEIALYKYGNSGLTKESGFIQQETPFTSNLDLVSEKLFALTTKGGDEFCGQVIYRSVKELEWGEGRSDYKTIFIAGNESFDQGPISQAVAFRDAKEKDIYVNAIFCGPEHDGYNLDWNSPVSFGAGSFASIDANKVTTYVSTPYDQRIEELNASLNDSYVWYGQDGYAAYNNMNDQDFNAKSISKSNFVNRAITKNSNFYNTRNDSWDLVDKLNTDPGFKVEDIKNEYLPKEMRKMTAKQKAAYVLEKQAKRRRINEEINTLAAQRSAYLSDQKTKQDTDFLEGAIITSIQAQAREKGFVFNNEQAAELPFVPALTDFDYFLELANEVKPVRKNRMVDFNQFLSMSKEAGTVILDTRSKEHFDAAHIKGAIHINFASFNVYDLAELIPDQNTRILIYCNNNINTDSDAAFKGIRNEQIKLELQASMVSKVALPPSLGNQSVPEIKKTGYRGAPVDPSKTMALNIPTFITLYGYGYKNIYELNQLVAPNDPRLVLQGTSIPAGGHMMR